MGSLEEAVFSGFICRLCSKFNRTVMFIFGVRGTQLDLVNKINSYLPVQVSREDELPKTICHSCLDKILQHHQLIERIHQVQEHFTQMREAALAAQGNNIEIRPEQTLPSASTICSTKESLDPDEKPIKPLREDPEAGTSKIRSGPYINTDNPTVSLDSHETPIKPLQEESKASTGTSVPDSDNDPISKRLRSSQAKKTNTCATSSSPVNALDINSLVLNELPNPVEVSSAALTPIRKRRYPVRTAKVVKKRTK